MRYSIQKATVERVKAVGGSDIKETRIGIIFATLTETQVAQLKARGCQVTEVGQVTATVMPPIVTPPVPVAAAPVYSPEQLVWAAGIEDLRGISDPPLYGEGINLAIIDSGIRESHEKIGGRVIYRRNFTSDPMRDGLDHGTGVCSIALTVAPLCNILNMKVLNDEGVGTEEEVVLAIDDCISLHDTEPDIAPTIMNLSLGSPDDGNPNNPLRVACRAAIDRDIWVMASAGNSGPAPYSITCPACEQYVFAVGSLKYDPFELSNFSSRGPTLEGLTKPDALMFGEDISIASSVSDTATTAKSGTSFAVPFCSGIVVGYHESVAKWVAYEVAQLPGVLPRGAIGRRVVTPQEMIDKYLLAICVKPEGAPVGKDYDYGCGLPLGSLIAQAITFMPLDISAVLTPVMSIITLGMFGMIMVPMTEAIR